MARTEGHLRAGRLAAIVAVVAAGCAATAPDVRVLGPLPRGVDPPIYLTAARQKERIDEALRRAGFQLVDRLEASLYLLRVTIGVDQGWRSCGTLNNVRYELRAQGRAIVVAEAKGWTGSCEPNVFDAVSDALRRRMVELTAQEGQGS